MDATPPDKLESAEPNPDEPPRSSRQLDQIDLEWLVQTIGGFVLVVISSLTAFVVTCVPLGVSNVLPPRGPDVPPPVPEWLPWVAGVVVGVGVGFGVSMYYFRSERQVDPMDPSASDGSNRGRR